MKNKEILRNNIKRLRLERNLKQTDLAELVEVEPKHISCIENGISFPSFDLLTRLSDAFKIELFELFLPEEDFNKEKIKKEIEKSINSASNEQLQKIYLTCKYMGL